MSVGEKVKIVSPPEFAYGPNGCPPIVPSDSNMEFEILLLRFQRPNADDKAEEEEKRKEISHLGDDLLV